MIGWGATGLAAARAAAGTGARVIVWDENPACGGGVQDDGATIDGMPAAQWIALTLRDLAAQPAVTLLARTTTFGYYDGNLVGAIERVTDHLATPPAYMPRLWLIRSKAVVLASGAIERAVAYANNDLPGTLLAGAAHTYVKRYGVRPGTRAVVCTNNDSAYATALALREAGVTVAAIVDARADTRPGGALPARARAAGLNVMPGSAVAEAHGTQRVTAVDIAALAGGAATRIDCDLIAVSGGWNPAVHLFSQARGKLRYDDALATFVPDSSPLPILPAGAANGRFDLAAALAEGHAAGVAAAARAGLGASSLAVPRANTMTTGTIEPLWAVPAPRKTSKRFVDLQNDVTVADIALAAREGYQAVEHLKRYTTLGMGTDQGKTSNVIGLALMAEQLSVPIPQVGTTTFRPPYTPVTLGAFPGQECGAHVEPTRYSAMHAWHVEHGARFVNAGLWKRPHSYPRSNETVDDAVNREARNVRTSAASSTCPPQDRAAGRDVAEFLNRVYINRDTLGVVAIMRCCATMASDGRRYLLRLSATHYLMTTTTVNAERMQQLEYLLQAEWPNSRYTRRSPNMAAAAYRASGREACQRRRHRCVQRGVSVFVGACQRPRGERLDPARLFRMSYGRARA